MRTESESDARAVANRPRYHADRHADLRDAMRDLLDAEIPILQTDLDADWRRECADRGISLSRIAAASPAELLRQLEQSGDAVRTWVVPDGERLRRLHWAARGYRVPLSQHGRPERIGAIEDARAGALRTEIAGLRARLARAEAVLAEIEAGRK